MSRVAVVTGANKGIGFGIVKVLCKRFDGVVYLTSRDDTRGRNAVSELNKLGLYPEYHQLDVSDRESVIRFRDYIKEKHGDIDILINNAGIVEDNFNSSYENSIKVIDVNFGSIITIHELIYPLVKNNGRILNISSCCGHLSNLRNEYWIERLSKKDLTIEDLYQFIEWYLKSKKNDTFNAEDFADGGTIAAYRVAKIALSAVTMIHQKELESRNIAVNSMHPGVVRTDMSKDQGFYDIDQAAETPIHLVLDAPQSLKGAYVWHDGTIVDWYDYKTDYYFKIETIFNN